MKGNAWAGPRPDYNNYPTLDREEAAAAAARLLSLEGRGVPVTDTVLLQIERWLRREARLLDSEDYSAWLDLLADDLFYWMPLRANRYRRDAQPDIASDAMAYFDDRKRDIVQRLGRIASGLVWGEDPPTRHVYAIGNLEAFETEVAREYEVHSTFIQSRNRAEHDDATLIGRRRDIWRERDNGYELVGRLILVNQSVLLTKNLSAFF